MLATKLLAFIRRGYLIESSYPLAFIAGLARPMVPVFLFYFVSRMVDTRSLELGPHSGRYFPYVLIGIALTEFFACALSVFSSSIRRAQMSGVLEATLSTQTGPRAVVLCDSAFSFLYAFLHLVVVLAAGHFLLGVDYQRTNVGAAALTFVLALAGFCGLGVFAATAIVVLKKGDPVELVFGPVNSLLSGAFYPISILPQWLQALAWLLPTTHALDALRLAIFEGASIHDLQSQLTALAVMAVLLLPTSLWTFAKAVEQARRDGTLLHY
jgi:ABC-2 type transport system permease protein